MINHTKSNKFIERLLTKRYDMGHTGDEVTSYTSSEWADIDWIVEELNYRHYNVSWEQNNCLLTVSITDTDYYKDDNTECNENN